MQIEKFQNNDYQTALVRCSNRTPRTGLIAEPLPKTHRALLLQFSLGELSHRVRGSLDDPISAFGEVRINLLTMEIRRSEECVQLTPREFGLLKFLIAAPRRVFSRNELLKEVWGYNNYPSTRTVDSHICSLRMKLEPTPAHPIHFLTVRGTGYRFEP